MKNLSQKAFTLIELLIVIAIIGVLVTIVIVAINPVRLLRDARDSTRRSDLQQVKAAMQLYYNECKFYPPSLPTSGAFANQSSLPCDNNTTYMRELPKAPDGSAYAYQTYTAAYGTPSSDTERQNYLLATVLDSPANPEDNATLTKCPGSVTDADLTTPGNQVAEYEVCND